MKDDTTQVVIVLWDETATELKKSSAKVLLDQLDQDSDNAPTLPSVLTNQCNTKHVFEIKSHTYYNYGDFESFTCTGVFPTDEYAVSDVADAPDDSGDVPPVASSTALKPELKRLVRSPQLTTPCKPDDGTGTLSRSLIRLIATMQRCNWMCMTKTMKRGKYEIFEVIIFLLNYFLKYVG